MSLRNSFSNGLTIAELKQIVNALPDQNDVGEPFTVWIETGKGLSSEVVEVRELNKRDSGSDLILYSRAFE